MKKVVLLTILLLLIALNSGLAAPEDKITRRIISEITWNPEVPRIEVHYIIIQKEKKQDFIVYPLVQSISNDQFEKKPWSMEEVREFINENAAHVYYSDVIFGQNVKVFADLSTRANLSKVELNKYIDLAKEAIIQDYKNPPQIKKDFEFINRAIQLIFLITIFVSVYCVIYLIKNRHK